MVAAVSTATAALNSKTTPRGGPRPQQQQQQQPRQNPTRRPLLPSESGNAIAPPRRPKSREVTSRYMSSSSSSSTTTTTTATSLNNSRRCPSPLVSRTAAASTATITPMPSVTKRSQSVERRRAVTPRPNSLDLRIGTGNGEVSAAQKLLFTSTRSLSVSFQGESFSLQVSKAKPAPSPNVRKGTPERRKVTTTTATTPARGSDQTENSKPAMDQQRWPARLRQANCMTRSLDCTDEKIKLSGSSGVVRALQNSMLDPRASFDGRLSSIELAAVEGNSTIGSETQSDPIASDTESGSSGSTSGAQDCNGGGLEGQRGNRGIMVPARFWSDTNNRLKRQPEPCSPLAKNVGAKAVTPKLIAPKKLSIDNPVSSPHGVVNSRGNLSPIRGALRPASPSKPGTSSPLRGMSPSRMRNAVVSATPIGNLSNTPSILSFAADVRRGKIGDNRIVDAHLLRLLHNRFLQWRFVNARADAALYAQKLNAERSLYNAWVTSSKLRESVRAKRTELQLLKQNLKLTSILKGQMTYLEEWPLTDRDYSSSLSGATEALRASTLRLPVVGGAKADIQNVKDAICSAVDVMQAMASSICLLSSKVGNVNSLVAELSKLSVKERALLDHCKDLLSTNAAMQVTECSLRTHIVQLKHVPPS
ncbi:QWRF motif-containing protein 2 [Quercus suber]|uniref:Qwrf motif-containing protein 2 n=1 Tax=Quercus suber TaxID=58331 RepID=A0AAW0KTA0_QUESU|nr:QWRF motif-containing protein 2-like [Quercus suber]